MKELKFGEFYGTHNSTNSYNNVLVTDTVYTLDKVDWHHHENPYFTYLLQGKLFEGNKSNNHYLEPGSLMFHNWQDAHYNKKSPEIIRGFHLELNSSWFAEYDINKLQIEGSILLQDPLIRSLMNQIFLESKKNDQYSSLAIDSILLTLFHRLRDKTNISKKKPQWLDQLKDLLTDELSTLSLTSLASALCIHPVHLSRSFSEHYGVTLGDYIRRIKLNKAFHLMLSKKYSLTEVAYLCGFYDQSHFTRNFKALYAMTPSQVSKKTHSC